jgi:hypothetical protein
MFSHEHLLVGSMVVLFGAIMFYLAYFGLPQWLDDWAIRQQWDAKDAIKAMNRYQRKHGETLEKVNQLIVDVERVYGDELRQARAQISLQERKARVAKRRPIQRKLGRI